ncbi:MAG: helix-turn-helix domain-containing protein [Defluviitaleaceae bacterium]|nr:helix-turn-helix domain-containing protein [Defluviitaleaceae bacterium]
MNAPKMLTVTEAAQKYGVAVWAIRQWTKPDGGLPFH